MSSKKNVAVIDGEKVRDAVIEPGTTAQDLLNQIELSPTEFWLTDKTGIPYGDDQEIYADLPEGAKVFAARRSNVAS